MALRTAELNLIVEWLTRQQPTKGGLRAWLAAKTSLESIARIREADSVWQDAQSIVLELDRTASRSLLDLLKEGSELDADIAEVARRYEAALAPPAVAPWQERLLWRRTVVLDRGPLRDALKTLLQTDQPKVLLVQGPRKSGKSKTADLVRHVAAAHKHPCAAVAQASEIDAAETVQEILAQLSDRTVVGPMPSPDTHWYRAQSSRVIAAAQAEMIRVAADRCWIVVDDLGAPSGTVATLCDYLVRAVARSTLGIRIVILGYPHDVLPDALDDVPVEWDRLLLGSVRETDVRDFLTWLYGDIVKRPLTEEALSSDVVTLLGGAAPESEGFLDRVRKGLEERTRTALKEIP